MSVRDVSERIPTGLRKESARRPLYPTRPDPTRPFYTWGDFSSCRPVGNGRAARLAMMSEANG
jgi:hypothetical protein